MWRGDPDLVDIVAAWPELPEAIRAGILAMVKAGLEGGSTMNVSRAIHDECGMDIEVGGVELAEGCGLLAESAPRPRDLHAQLGPPPRMPRCLGRLIGRIASRRGAAPVSSDLRQCPVWLERVVSQSWLAALVGAAPGCEQRDGQPCQ